MTTSKALVCDACERLYSPHIIRRLPLATKTRAAVQLCDSCRRRQLASWLRLEPAEPRRGLS